jgi:hypothetical protein
VNCSDEVIPLIHRLFILSYFIQIQQKTCFKLASCRLPPWPRSKQQPVCDVQVRTTTRVGRGQGSFFDKEIAPPLLGGAANGGNMEGHYSFA